MKSLGETVARVLDRATKGDADDLFCRAIR
jgi:hypothetical protein